jgi:hypothetical protein
MKGDWKQCHSKKIHILYSSLFVRLSNSRRIRWAGDVAYMEEMRNKCTLLSENLKGADSLEDLYITGRIILKLALKKWCGRVRSGIV